MVDDRLVTMQIWDTAGQVSESCYILGKVEATEIGPKFDFYFVTKLELHNILIAIKRRPC